MINEYDLFMYVYFFGGRGLYLLHRIVSAAIVFHTECCCYSNNDKRDSITYKVKPVK